MAANGLQYSTPVVATSTGVTASFGFKAHTVYFVNATTSQAVFIDLTGADSAVASSSASWKIVGGGTLGPLYTESPWAYWTGFSCKSSDSPITINPLALS